MNDLTVLEEELLETNVGFRFLYDNTQTQSSAMMKLQWCAAPQILKSLEDCRADNAQVFITVKNPRGKENRYVFPLICPQVLIQFHCPGEHFISGVVVWGENNHRLRNMEESFLQKYSRDTYPSNSASQIIKLCYGVKLGMAEISMTVADGFFAPKLSPWMEWYSNLGYGEQPWDSCEIARRVNIARWVKTPLFMVWIPFISTIRLICAIWFGALLARKGVEWESVIHPFINKTKDVFRYSKKRWKGESLKRFFFVPLHQVLLVSSSLMSNYIANKTAITQTSSTAGIFSYLLLAMIPISLVVFPKVIKFLQTMTKKEMTANEIARLRDKNSKTWEQKQEKILLAEDLERRKREATDLALGKTLNTLYSDLACTTAPVNGVPRTERRGVINNFVLKYQEFKFNHCCPVASE